MNVDEIYSANGEWLKAEDLSGRAEWHLKIEHVSSHVFKQRDGTEKPQVVLHFFGAKKKLGLNVTNKNRMKKMFGAETDNWISQEVTLYTVETEMDGESRQGIRIRDYPAKPLVKSEPPAKKGFVSGLPEQPRTQPKTASASPLMTKDDMNDEIPF